MSTVRLALKDCNETLLRRQVLAKIKADPTLARVVKRWILFTGQNNELAEPVLADCPYIGIWPSGGRAEPATERTTKSPMNLEVYIGVAGTDMDDAMNLWDAFRNACYPGDKSMQAIITGHQGETLVLEQAPYAAVPLDGGTGMLIAKGLLSIRMYTQTAT